MINFILSLLSAAVNDSSPISPPADVNWELLYQFFENQSLACTAWYGIMKLEEKDRPDKDILNKFQKSMLTVRGRESMQQLELENVMAHFEKEGIDYVPLKGWIIKNLYPKPDMRSMCDVDILIRDEDKKKIPVIMKACGFNLMHRGQCDDEYIKPPTITTEIHRSLFSVTTPFYEYFANAMDKTVPLDKSHQRRMTIEDFYLHIIAHLAKHFGNSGTGLRPILDIWILEKYNAGNTFDENYFYSELEKLKLKDFYNIISDIAKKWFSENEETGTKNDDNAYTNSEIEEYILMNSTYGSIKSWASNNINKVSGNKFVYYTKRLFPGIHFMKNQFWILDKMPFLLPFCWVLRGIRIIIFKRDHVSDELKVINSNTENKAYIEKLARIKKLTGLDDID